MWAWGRGQGALMVGGGRALLGVVWGKRAGAEAPEKTSLRDREQRLRLCHGGWLPGYSTASLLTVPAAASHAEHRFAV